MVVASLNSLNATSYTDPIGALVTTVTARGDTVVGAPLYRATELNDTATAIASGVITATADLTGADYTTEAHFVLMTSGADRGNYYTVDANDATSITIDLNGGSDPSVGTYKVIPYWTLDTLFPDGGAVPASADPFNPSGLVLFNDLTTIGVNLSKSSVYFYYDGTIGGTAGWYNNDDLNAGLVGHTIILPEHFITIRNHTSSDSDVVVSGQVPADIIATEIGRLADAAQDNAVVNPYPAPILLDNSGLVTSGVVSGSTDPFNPTDLILVFDNAAFSGFNLSTSRVYFYYNGSGAEELEGWYENGVLGRGSIGGVDSIPTGGAFIVRKASGPAGTDTWAPMVPYTLMD
ncbi:MAG: TIGR02597 family protein [Lentimonas sp.]